MDPMAAIRETFFQECAEQLTALEAGLLAMDEGDTGSETVNAVFRAVHSIKGGAGAFKLDELVHFAHVFETALDRIRSGKLTPDADVMKLMLRAVDVLSDLVTASRDGGPVDAGQGAPIVDEFNALIGQPGGEAEDAGDDFGDVDFQPVVIAIDGSDAEAVPAPPPERCFTIKFRPSRELYAKANEPVVLLRELARLGAMRAECDASALPPLGDLDPSGSYLAWTIRLQTEKNEAAIREVFEFVDGDCELAVESDDPPPQADLDIAALLAHAQAEPTIVQTAPEPANGSAPPPAAAAKTESRPAGGQATIRVDLDRVDRLINLVGELVINQAMLSQRVSESGIGGNTAIAMSLDDLGQLTREIQESVMAIRAQPVKPLFQRMSRIIREVAEATGKEVRLKTEGEATEVDKTVIELLADPLTHMIRNAVDHGLEKPEDRAAAGKTAEGIVRLTAAHRSGRVVIEVADDGAGINRPRVLESAIRKGLVAPDAQLSDSEIDNLLFLPGFSTAATVSSISGRGVGMDVVKRSIQALGGRISIVSKPKEGSTFSMSLPLTLAVLDGIVVSIDEQTYVIPLTTIVETLKPEPADVNSLGEGHFVLRSRGSFVPLIDAGVELGSRPRAAKLRGGIVILVETENRSRSALLVDAIQDQRQVVIKSLEANYRQVPGVAAATILGDGRVAMILDVDALAGGLRGGAAVLEQRLAKAS